MLSTVLVTVKSEFCTLYQSNNDLEEFCIRQQVHPINVWYLFKESKILPQARVSEFVLEFLAGAFRTILMNDEDGIVPLVGLPGEPKLNITSLGTSVTILTCFPICLKHHLSGI